MNESSTGKVYLIPSPLDVDGLETIPAYILPAVKQCSAFFVENERTTRRFLKLLEKEIVIDDYAWINIREVNPAELKKLEDFLMRGQHIGIISEAGCPGIADPGQLLVAHAHKTGAEVFPLVGPSSILLALMASGLNGQQFSFHGYLPVETEARKKTLAKLEKNCLHTGATQIFIETPYRNVKLVEDVLSTLNASTLFCIAADLTGKYQWIKTFTVAQWKKIPLSGLHKRPAIFLIGRG